MYQLKRFARHPLWAILAVVMGLSLPRPALSQEFQDSFAVDLQKYAGLWYDTARTPNDFQDNTLMRDGKRFGACLNSTATYSVSSPNAIDVLNRCQRRADDGTITEESITGIALAGEGTQNRKLKIAFGSGVARFFQRAFASRGGFDYWIYCLGSVNDDGLYDWAVVSGADKSFLFILTRDQFISNDRREEILSCALNENLPVDKLIYTQEKL